MKLLSLGKRAITVIDELGTKDMILEVDATGIHMHGTIKRSHEEELDVYLDLGFKFEWRDMWVGVFKGKDATYICPLPMLPLILKVKTS